MPYRKPYPPEFRAEALRLARQRGEGWSWSFLSWTSSPISSPGGTIIATTWLNFR
jgi:hypothetical protein